MSDQPYHTLSVDCVIFGFDGRALKVLLLDRNFTDTDGMIRQDHKLPGSLIYEHEDVRTAANRLLETYTGKREIYLQQLHVFSHPDRVNGEELRWLNRHYAVRATRMVTVAYYSLVKLDRSLEKYAAKNRARWTDIDTIQKLAMDHKQILATALETLSRQFLSEPIAFELLPRKFTLRKLQDLYEAILGIEIDNRNFRKKVLSWGYIRPSGEKEQGVAHKPALLYTFDRLKYRRDNRQKFRLNFIHWRT